LLEPGLEPLSYAELRQALDELSAKLHGLEITAAHRVALVMPNSSATAMLILALSRHCTLLPLNPEYRAREFEYFYSRAGVDVVITDRDTSHAAQRCARARQLSILEVTASNLQAGRCDLASDPAAPVRAARNANPGPALLMHTSGSTAEPKLVPLQHAHLLASCANLVASLRITAQDRGLGMMPMFHIGAIVDLLLAPLSVGASLVLPRDNSATTFFACLQQFEPSWYQGVPTMLRDIVTTLKANPELAQHTRSLRLLRSVSSALPNRLLHGLETLLDTRVIEIYGMTETAGLICSNPLDEGRQKQGSVGLPCGCELRIADAAGRPAERGEVLVRGANVFNGYVDADGPAGGEFVDGYLRTGDEGYLDADGYLYLCGRIKEIINRGGEKISPLEIDRVAETHPAVRAAAAFALPHASLGEEVALAVIPQSGASYDETDLRGYLEARLSPHKLPRRIFYPSKLPRAAGGKLRRRQLAEWLQGEDERLRRPAWRAPDSPLARELASLWERALDIEAVGLEDNFFDLGGDSLSAAAIVGELRLRYPSLHAAVLYEHPTLGALARQLEELPAEIAAGDEDTDIAGILRPFLGAWQGERLDRDALIVGRNCGGNRTPLFWCVNGFSEYDALSRLMDAEQPVYGMRSLFDTGYKSDSATLRLARLYADEVMRIQPRGPYLLGGFCEGGRVAFLIAQTLRARGETVASLLLQEQFVASPYSGRVAMFICRPGRNNPYHNYLDAPRGWRKYYSGDLQLYRMSGRHKDVYLKPDIEVFAAQLKRELQRALAYRHDDGRDRRNQLQRLPLDAYQARIKTRAPARVVPGTSFEIDVEVTNASAFDWKPTHASGILLGAKWNKSSGETRTWMAGASELPQELHPGESLHLPLRIKAPLRFKPHTLELDLVDDGVSWFADMGSAPSRHRVELSLLSFKNKQDNQ